MPKLDKPVQNKQIVIIVVKIDIFKETLYFEEHIKQ